MTTLRRGQRSVLRQTCVGNASLGIGKKYNHRVNLTCADCEQPLETGDKGSECANCKSWPLCHACDHAVHGCRA